MDGESTTVILTKPLTLGSLSYEQLVIREPTCSEWSQWDQLQGVEANIKALSIVCAVPEPVMRQLGVRDFQRAVEALYSFFDPAATKAG